MKNGTKYIAVLSYQGGMTSALYLLGFRMNVDKDHKQLVFGSLFIEKERLTEVHQKWLLLSEQLGLLTWTQIGE